MAELVGDAYVRIHADTTGMQRAIERDVERIADDSANSYLESFDRYVRDHSDAKLRSIYSSLARAIATGDWDRAFAQAGTSIERFANDSRAHIISINNALEQISGPGGGMEDFQERLGELDRWAQSRGLEGVFDRVGDNIGSAGDAVDRFNANIGETEGDVDRAGTAFRNLRYRVRELADDVEENDNLFRRWGRSLGRTVILLNRDTDIVGRMFGAGSRSEFLNFFGRVINFFAELPIVALTAFSRMWNGVVDLVDQFKELRKQGQSVSTILSGFGTTLLRAVGPALAGVVLTVAALSQVLPALSVLLLNLVGIVLALASAIVVGLAGALIVVLGLIPALIGGIGYLIIGMSRWGDATDAMKKKLKPLTDAWANFQKRVGNTFLQTLADNAKGLATIIKGTLEPMFMKIGEVVGKLVKQFTDLWNSKGMKPFIDALKTSIPRVLESLGSAFNKFGAALTVVFAVLAPYVERFAKWLERSADTFLRWASSTEGRTELRQWFEDLWGTAKKLWSMLGSIARVLGTIIKAATGVGSGGQGTGIDFLTGITTSLEKFDKWLNEPVTPQGDDILDRLVKNPTRIEQWFKDVRDTAKGLVDILGTIADKLKEIDWDEVQRNVKTFLEVMGTALGILAGIMTTASGIISTIRKTFEEEQGLQEGGKGLLDEWNMFLDGLTSGDAAKRFGDWFSEINTALTAGTNTIHEALFGDGGFFTSTLPNAWNAGWDALFGDMGVFDRGHEALFGEGGFFPTLGADIGNWFTVTLPETFTGWYDAINEPLTTGTNQIHDALFGEGGFFPNLGTEIGNFFTVTLPETFGGWYDAINDPLTTGTMQIHDALFGDGGFFPTIGNNIATWFAELPGNIASWASGVWDALTQPFRDWWNSLFGASIFPDVLSGIAEYLGRIPGVITSALSTVWSNLTQPFVTAWATLSAEVSTWPGKIGTFISQIPGKITGALSTLWNTVSQPFRTAWATVSKEVSSWPGKIGAFVSQIPGKIAGALSGLVSAFTQPFRNAWTAVSGWLTNIANLIRNFRFPSVSLPSFSIPEWLKPGATGGLVYGPTAMLVGEAGREAIVPLDRPLSLVDPSVRALAAFAQGKMTSSGLSGGARVVIEPGAIIVNSPASNPALVAEAVVDRIAARITV